MKKILGISLVAVFAVLPLVAQAGDRLNAAVTVASGVEESGTALTQQAYVKGAYNAALGEIRNVNTVVTALTADDTTAGSVLKTVKDKSALATYDASDEAYVSGTIGYAVKNAVQSSNIATSLSNASTDAQVASAKAVYDELATKQNAITAQNQLNAGLVQEDTTHRFITDSERTSWTNTATAVASYSADLSAKQDKDDSTITTAQAEAHEILDEGAGVAGNLVNLASGIEAIDSAEIPVATTWAGDVSSTVTIGSLHD